MAARVLVASLHREVREEACRALSAHGYDGVPIAEASAVATEMVRDGIALALVDVSLVAQLAAADAPGSLRPPLVLMSDAGARLTERAARDAGAIDAITVPFDHDALVAVVEHALNRASRTPEASPREPSRTSIQLGEEAVVDLADGELVLAGALGAVPMGAVLQLLHLENQSGVLSVRNARSKIIASLRNGTIDLVQSQGAGDEFRLGRFFVLEGLVTPEEIDELLASRRSSPDNESSSTILGDVLLASGKITRAQLRSALLRQSSELVYEILRWTSGVFEFRRKPATALAERAQLGIPVATLVMEGFRRVDEWRVIEARVGRGDEVPVRDEVTIVSVGVDQLPQAERTVLGLVDGVRTVREIVERAQMSSFEAFRTLAELFEARLVRRRAPP